MLLAPVPSLRYDCSATLSPFLLLEDKLILFSVLLKSTVKPVSQYETRHVDWVQTQHLGYSNANVANEDLSRHKRALDGGRLARI